MAHVEIEDIEEILEKLDIMAIEFARETYVSRSYISHLMSGRKSNPSRLWAAQVARYCRSKRLREIANRIEERIEDDGDD